MEISLGRVVEVGYMKSKRREIIEEVEDGDVCEV